MSEYILVRMILGGLLLGGYFVFILWLFRYEIKWVVRKLKGEGKSG